MLIEKNNEKVAQYGGWAFVWARFWDKNKHKNLEI